MKDGKTKAQIATLMDRHKSTISRELARNTGLKGYRPKQACLLSKEYSKGDKRKIQWPIASIYPQEKIVIHCYYRGD